MKPQEAVPVKLVIAALYNDTDQLKNAMTALDELFGQVDFIEGNFPFDVTDYYEKEMGPGLKRTIIAFEQLIDPASLAEVKIITNSIEDHFAAKGNRCINLDSGYIDLHKVVLASAKYAGPKVYVGKGIYADTVLYFYDGKFTPTEWTFPDFKTNRYNDIFSKIRNIYKTQLRKTSTPAGYDNEPTEDDS